MLLDGPELLQPVENWCRRASCRQLVEQRLGLFQVERIKAFGEPAVDRREKLASLPPLALIAPEPRHAHRGTQFQGLCLLLARDGERALEVRCCFRGIRSVETTQQKWCEAEVNRIAGEYRAQPSM
jgi:hypothetical protein